jgi:hypothetical protein
MTIAEILQQVIDEYGAKNQITEAQALRYLNQIQTIAFTRDMNALLVFSDYLTVVEGQREYAFPTSPLCRKFVGVTQYDPRAILGIPFTETDITSLDYGRLESTEPRSIYEQLIVDPIKRIYTFSEDPSTVADTYRIVYYRRPPTILNSTDDTNLLIPPEHHWTTVVQGMSKLADNDLYDDKTPKQVLEPIMQDFWDELAQSTDLGNRNSWNNQGGVL